MSETWGNDRLHAEVRERVADWRRTNAWIEREERRAMEDPGAYVELFVAHVHRQRRNIRRFVLRRFGVKVNYRGRLLGEQYLAFPERFPLRFYYCPEDYSLFLWFRAWSDLLTWYDIAWKVICSARILALREGADPNEAVVRNIFEYHRAGPWMATPTEKTEPIPELREDYAKNLSGWVGSRVSLQTNERLNAVLGENLEPGTSPSARLMEELLAATIVAYDGLVSEETTGSGNVGGSGRTEDSGESSEAGQGRFPLVNLVAGLLEELGGETAKLAREGKLARAEPESDAADADNDIEHYVAEETLRQQIEMLRVWVEKAGLPGRERQVYELVMQGYKDSAIAVEMGVERSTVRGLRKRYTDRLRKIANR
jgi:DNA-binding CsgD family transcriptional regulator